MDIRRKRRSPGQEIINQSVGPVRTADKEEHEASHGQKDNRPRTNYSKDTRMIKAVNEWLSQKGRLKHEQKSKKEIAMFWDVSLSTFEKYTHCDPNKRRKLGKQCGAKASVSIEKCELIRQFATTAQGANDGPSASMIIRKLKQVAKNMTTKQARKFYHQTFKKRYMQVSKQPIPDDAPEDVITAHVKVRVAGNPRPPMTSSPKLSSSTTSKAPPSCLASNNASLTIYPNLHEQKTDNSLSNLGQQKQALSPNNEETLSIVGRGQGQPDAVVSVVPYQPTSGPNRHFLPDEQKMFDVNGDEDGMGVGFECDLNCTFEDGDGVDGDLDDCDPWTASHESVSPIGQNSPNEKFANVPDQNEDPETVHLAIEAFLAKHDSCMSSHTAYGTKGEEQSKCKKGSSPWIVIQSCDSNGNFDRCSDCGVDDSNGNHDRSPDGVVDSCDSNCYRCSDSGIEGSYCNYVRSSDCGLDHGNGNRDRISDGGVEDSHVNREKADVVVDHPTLPLPLNEFNYHKVRSFLNPTEEPPTIIAESIPKIEVASDDEASDEVIIFPFPTGPSKERGKIIEKDLVGITSSFTGGNNDSAIARVDSVDNAIKTNGYGELLVETGYDCDDDGVLNDTGDNKDSNVLGEQTGDIGGDNGEGGGGAVEKKTRETAPATESAILIFSSDGGTKDDDRNRDRSRDGGNEGSNGNRDRRSSGGVENSNDRKRKAENLSCSGGGRLRNLGFVIGRLVKSITFYLKRKTSSSDSGSRCSFANKQSLKSFDHSIGNAILQSVNKMEEYDMEVGETEQEDEKTAAATTTMLATTVPTTKNSAYMSDGTKRLKIEFGMLSTEANSVNFKPTSDSKTMKGDVTFQVLIPVQQQGKRESMTRNGQQQPPVHPQLYQQQGPKTTDLKTKLNSVDETETTTYDSRDRENTDIDSSVIRENKPTSKLDIDRRSVESDISGSLGRFSTKNARCSGKINGLVQTVLFRQRNQQRIDCSSSTFLPINVQILYQIAKACAGGVGGNTITGDGINGETVHNHQEKLILEMKKHTGLGPNSRFLDVGSGCGKPCLHVAQHDVQASCGIEHVKLRYFLSMNNLRDVIDAADICNQMKSNCCFVLDTITNAKTFDPFTHVFMYSVGMPPELMFTMAQIWNKSRSEFLISYHNEAAKQYGYDIDLITTCQTSMYMSGRTHTCHLYRRKQRGKIPSSEKENDIEFGFPCDPIFKEAFDLCLKAVSERRTYVSNEIIACYKREPRARKPNYYLEIDRIARESSARQGAVLSKKRRAHCVVVSKRKRGKKIIY